MMDNPTTALFLSCLTLNPRSRQVMSELAHPYEMHRTLLRAFPKAKDEAQCKAREEFGVLFRAEPDESPEVVKVIVQSLVEPNWSFLDGLNGYLSPRRILDRFEHKDVMPAARMIRDGQVLSFRLRANPTKRVARDDDTMKGKRVALKREEQHIAWLVEKGKGKEREENAPRAFEPLFRMGWDKDGNKVPIPCFNARCEGYQSGRKTDAHGEHQTAHFAVLFDGVLRVTNRDAFLEMLVGGVGPAKAFGFGLLSVAPVPQGGT